MFKDLPSVLMDIVQRIAITYHRHGCGSTLLSSGLCSSFLVFSIAYLF